MKNPTLYVIGDSTVSSFNDPYYYPRYGYGTQLGCYFRKIEIVNLALSGRSSKSFIQEDNYKLLLSSLKPGDYLMIGFGHNDEKSDDPLRFTDATKSINDEGSFSFSLFQNYIKPALEKQAIPILCTPICRVNHGNDYTGSSAHQTPNGNYAMAIIELGQTKGIPVLNLTEKTRLQYETLGYQEASLYHATIAGKYADDGITTLPDENTVDTTHLNHYGAKYVAYLIATLVKETELDLKKYLIEPIEKPLKEIDLVMNPEYVIKIYEVPHLDNYSPNSHFKVFKEGWYGTAFGDCGGIPDDLAHGYLAKEIENGIYYVGQTGASLKGKLALTTDGFSFLFHQIPVEDNFTISVRAKVVKTANAKQAGFGLMLRDDCYLHQNCSTEMVTSNYLAAGLITTDVTMSPIFYREQAELHKEDPILSYLYKEGDEALIRIIRVGQSMQLWICYEGIVYEKTFVDFDLLAIDHEYMYVGMFATRGTVIEFSDVEFEMTGKSQGA